jgi:peptide/nickel transport system ATP-binding protein
LPGEPGNALAIPSGCAFHPRCGERVERCSTEVPTLFTTDGTSRHLASCLLTMAAADQRFAG